MLLKILTNFIKGFLFLALGFIIAMPISMFVIYLATFFNIYVILIVFIILGSCALGFLNK